MRSRAGLVALVTLAVGFGWAANAHAQAPDEARYIVTLQKSVGDVDKEAKELKAEAGTGAVVDTYTKVKGFLVNATSSEAKELRSQPEVKAVEKDGVVSLKATQNGPPWGLDRIDQRNRPLSNTYTYNQTGVGVDAYMIDTGIHATHQDFSGRVQPGTNTVDASPSTTDCNGHGTHTAGTVGGETYGVAKDVTLIAVRVFGCGNTTATSDIIEGVDWVVANHNAGEPAVANMSLGGGASAAMDNAVAAMIADGVSTSVASGNESANACNSSPGRLATAITVGATDINDARASFSNFGTCVDLHGPGVGVVSAAPSSDTATATLSGTSMATPHVAGAAALYLESNPGASPATVHNAIVTNATTGVISGIQTSCSFLDNLLGTCTAGTPNKLLFTGSGSEPPPPPPPPPPACNALQRLLGLC
jgi:subtilisin family serine protease